MEKLFASAYWLTIFETLSDWVINVFPSLLLLLVILFVSLKLLRFFVKRLSKIALYRAKKDFKKDEIESEKRINTLAGILWGVGKIGIWATAMFIILQEIGIDVKPILAGAGILGLAVGFGAQELVRDVISGFFILLENQVRTGDVGIINGTGGMVEKIELRTITLRDFSGVVHIFQNGKISTLSNMTKEWSAMVFDIGVAYKEDPEQVIQIMAAVGADLQKDPVFGPRIIEPIEVVGVNEFADSAVVIKARIKTKPIEQWNVGREYRKRLKLAFDAKNIEIPFPHQTIYWGEKIGPLKMKIENEDQRFSKD
ncbi:MAG: mechanosensitive ion channel family protein [Prolixibacteraceae bacterium]|jgi:small-conductance mechanosensitive channel|nr:mechanosensitive ion channel family protein [Prolixibacteraceae bacterium]